MKSDAHLNRLIANAKKAPPLSREEERTLLKQWQASRSRSAGNRLARTHLRLVVFLALKYRRYGVPVDELIAEGNLGLMRALDRFDPDFGTRFSTYASYWIRCFIVGCVLKSKSLVGGGTGVFNTRTFFKLRRERAKVQSLLGDTDEARKKLAEIMQVTETQVRKMEQRLDFRDLSLDAPVREHADATRLDLLSCESDQHEKLERVDQAHAMKSSLRQALDTLSERERYIVEQRLMADSGEEMSLSELGRHFGVSRERVRQLEERAKEKLRTSVIRSHAKTRRKFERRLVSI